MRKVIGIVAALVATLWIPATGASSPRCPRCNIVQEGLLGPSLVRTYVYEQDEDGRFYRVRVEQVGTAPPAIYRQILDGRLRWNTASAFYSETSMNEIVAAARGGAPAYQETDVDRQHRTGVLAACASYVSAKKNGDIITAAIMEGGCCRSSWSRKYAPSGVCGW